MHLSITCWVQALGREILQHRKLHTQALPESDWAWNMELRGKVLTACQGSKASWVLG